MTYIEKLKELKQSAPTSWPELQDYCSVGYAIRQHKISGSVIRKAFRFFSIISLHRDPKSIPIFSIISLHRDPKYIQICFLHINLHHAIVE